jgi:transcriptional regulator with PAS, ATPase and Fis domain/tetratricopeptide (TPR) repeat protein
MTPSTYESAAQLAAAGHFAAALNLVEKSGGAKNSASPLDVLRAELLERAGRFRQSKSIVETLTKSRRIDRAERSSCEFILGKIDWEEGYTESAISHIQRAVALASEIGDLRKKCWANLWLFVLIADRSGPNAAAPIVTELRKDAIRLGDAQVLAGLHLYAGQLDAKRGLLRTAAAHLKRCQDILYREPNVWLDAQLQYTTANLAILKSDHKSALEHARRAVMLAEESGGAACLRTCLGTLGIVFYLLGEFNDGIRSFSRALTILPSDGDSRRSMIDALARIRLAQGDLSQCGQLLDQVAVDPNDRLIYSHRYSALTRAQLLGRRNNFNDALTQIDQTLALARESQDHFLLHLATLTKSQLLQEAMRVPAAFDLLKSFPVDFAGQSPEIYAQYEMILACSLASMGLSGEGEGHKDRAERIYQGLAHAPGLIELKRCWSQAIRGEKHPDLMSAGSPTMPARTSTPGGVTQSIAGLLLLADRPELLARGIIDLLQVTAVVTRAVATISGDDGEYEVLATINHSDEGKRAFLELPRQLTVGQLHERSVEVWLAAKDDIESIATLNAITLLLSTIHEIERGRAEREERLTLWPIEDVPIQNVGQAVISGRMRETMDLAKRVATTDAGVLITGESGTGKEILARAIHTYSHRAEGPLVPFNCAAVPREMLESQLFGHRRGAFTGADRDNPGVIRAARGGTLFLDEIGELAIELQPKLLRFLESSEICPLGETTPFTVDVRVIAATNANLEQAVKNGRFREDLYYRLHIVPLQIPPLRDRRDEIPALVHHFVMRAAAEYRKGQIRVAENTMEQLLLFPWPGNVRQLQNELRRMVALAEPDAILGPRALSPEIASVRAERAANATPRADKLSLALARIEREMIKAALREHHGKTEAAAKALGISRKGLYLKRQRLGL